MDRQKVQFAFGLTILSAFAFLFCADLFLSIQMFYSKGIWFPLLLVIVCPLCVYVQWGYFHLKKKDEEQRRRPPINSPLNTPLV